MRRIHITHNGPPAVFAVYETRGASFYTGAYYNADEERWFFDGGRAVVDHPIDNGRFYGGARSRLVLFEDDMIGFYPPDYEDEALAAIGLRRVS